METRLAAVLAGLLVVGGALGLESGCGASNDGGLDSAGGAACGSAACGAVGCGGSTCGGCGTTTPPEKELESSYTAPVATGHYVWIANPTSGRVAYIDATTLQIRLVDAGDAPTYLAAIPSATDDVAVVLNVLSLDATVLRAHDGAVTAAEVPIPSSGNGWAVSHHGRYAVAWTDARQVTDADPLDGFQAATIVDLSKKQPSAQELTVGYRPVAFAFDASETRAFAVTQDGVTVIALDAAGGPAVVKNIALSDDPTEDATTRDVAITPDGGYAVVRRDGASALTVVALSDGTRVDVPLPAAATDMDLTTDGSKAVVVMRSTGQVGLVPIPGVLTDPNFTSVQIDGATIGSVALPASSPVGFFYTNATPSDLLVTLDTSAASPSPKTTLLRAPIEAVFPTIDAKNALVLHAVPPDDGAGTYAAAFSLLPVALGLPPKIVGVHATPIAVAMAPAGDHAIVATGDADKQVYELYVGALPSLEV
ncbi:MAG TPA: hypothetical protein VHB21_26990, partial [Minicystis sp.]|nr:hypothetical protein [Minicystis sp.]